MLRMKNKNNQEKEREYEKMLVELKSLSEYIKAGAKLEDNSQYYYKLKDLREPTLFLLANDYKQRKYYCDFETIKLMCEGVPINFIKLCSELFNELRYSLPLFEKNKCLDIQKQNRAIRKVASDTRKDFSSCLTNWQGFQILLDELGFIFRQIQLSPTAPYPTPNGFSIEKGNEWLQHSETQNDELNLLYSGIPLDLKNILIEAEDWGFLIKMPHRSKTESLKTRTKYYINSMLAPYYDLSVRHLKEPLYLSVSQLENLCSTDGQLRAHTRNIIINSIRSLSGNI